jgi:hypothetical protein
VWLLIYVRTLFDLTRLTVTQSRKAYKFYCASAAVAAVAAVIAAVAVAAVEAVAVAAGVAAVAAMTEDSCLMAASLTRPDLEGHGASTLGKPSFPMHHHSFA